MSKLTSTHAVAAAPPQALPPPCIIVTGTRVNAVLTVREWNGALRDEYRTFATVQAAQGWISAWLASQGEAA
jgi:hypothetical protein